MNDIKTQFQKINKLGSAKYGTAHFLKQRVTAFANIFLLSFFVVFLILCKDKSYNDIINYIKNPFNSSILILVMISIPYHMQLGMQVIIEDYVHSSYIKIILLLLNIFFSIFISVISIISILKICFGS